MIEERTPERHNSSFSETLPTLQLAYDSTSLGYLKQCPRAYQYAIVDGYEPRETSVHLRFGIEYGAATEVLDRARVAGVTTKEATEAAVQHALAATWNAAAGRPWESDDANKNRETLVRSIIDYADHFGDDALVTLRLASGEAAAEQSFRFPVPGAAESITGEEFSFCGYLDRVVTWQDRIWVTDRKTTRSALNRAYFAKYTPDNQVSLYVLASQIVFETDVNGMIIDAVQVLATKSDFRRGIIERSASQLAEWLTDAKFYIGLAELFATRNYWPQNDKACGNTYLDPKTGEISYGCPFRSVCASGPEVRDELLRLNFKRRTWDPLKIREAKRHKDAATALKTELGL